MPTNVPSPRRTVQIFAAARVHIVEHLARNSFCVVERLVRRPIPIAHRLFVAANLEEFAGIGQREWREVDAMRFERGHETEAARAFRHMGSSGGAPLGAMFGFATKPWRS